MDVSRMPKIVKVMTPFPYAIGIGESAAAAAQLMQEHGVRHLPVKDGNELVSVLSERDLQSAQRRAGPESESELRVKDVCALDAYVVDVSESLDLVLLTMAERHIGSALVVKNHQLAGIFTATDACRSFCDFLRERFPPSTGNDAA